jgi:hypothetical protein
MTHFFLLLNCVNLKIYTRPLEEQRPSYAILGLLIFVQLGISLVVMIKQSLTRENKIEKMYVGFLASPFSLLGKN